MAIKSDDIPIFAVFAFALGLWIAWGFWFIYQAYTREDPWWRPRRTYRSNDRRRRQADAESDAAPAVAIDLDYFCFGYYSDPSHPTDQKRHLSSCESLEIVLSASRRESSACDDSDRPKHAII